MRVAAIDVGTNTVRLLVADVDDGRLTDVARDREITRLGQGVDAERRLAHEAVARTLDVIETFAARAKVHGAERTRIAGTSVLRDAKDREDFFFAVREKTGIALEVLSGADEGRISYLGATSELEPSDYVVCDIGGGSTELSSSQTSVSVDIGSVRLTERFLQSSPPSTSQIEAARRYTTDTLVEATDVITGGQALVGVAGTITTLTAVVLGLGEYDHDRVHLARITRADVVRWSVRLLTMTADEILALGPVEAGRADVIGGGVLVLRTVMDRFGFDDVLVSERDILDGLVLDLSTKR